MKLRKVAALLLGAAVLTSAAVPMASAEAADFSINGQEEFFAPAEGISATFGEDGALTLTIEDAAVSGSGGHMMWTQVEDPFVNLAETPYLCWEVTGTGNWGLAVRYDENVDDSTCYRMHIARGHEEDGLAPETNSINFLELLKNNDLGLLHNADEITMVAVAMNVFGDAGDSITFKRLYFSASPIGEGGAGPVGTTASTEAPATTTTEPTTTTAPTTTATAASTTTTTTTTASAESGSNTGLIVGIVVAVVVVAAAAVGVVFYLKKKKKND